MRNTLFRLIATLTITLGPGLAISFGQPHAADTPRVHPRDSRLKVRRTVSADEARNTVLKSMAAGSSPLPVFSYEILSTRDGARYSGFMVGANPRTRGTAAQVTVKAQLIPVVLRFHSIGLGIDLGTGAIATTSGDRVSDPTIADPACLAGGANVPLALMRQSPIFRNADFNFGGTDVGTTQYIDAFQRGNFWSVIDRENYHILLERELLVPIIVDVPASSGVSLDPGAVTQAAMCGPQGLVDINFLDAVLAQEMSRRRTIDPGTLPMFLMYNTGLMDGPDLRNGVAGGYRGVRPAGPGALQTYTVFSFDVSGFFHTLSTADDVGIAAHELVEWLDDPYGINDTPLWGHTGEVADCARGLQAADPLVGIQTLRIVGRNGYTYHLPESAFFSWFFGGPTTGVHGWLSNNGTFLVDAGPACTVDQAAMR